MAVLLVVHGAAVLTSADQADARRVATAVLETQLVVSGTRPPVTPLVTSKGFHHSNTATNCSTRLFLNGCCENCDSRVHREPAHVALIID